MIFEKGQINKKDCQKLKDNKHAYLFSKAKLS